MVKPRLNMMKAVLAKIAFLTGVLFTLTAAAQTRYSNTVWISTNATGNLYPNGGTLDSPLDGSTAANFDYNISNLPPYCTIHLLPGTFQEEPVLGYGYVKSGQKYIGSGMDVTIVQLVASVGDGGTVFENYDDSPGYNVTNAEISDLTVDANGTAGANYAHGGIEVYGTENAVRRVKVINTYAPPRPEETGGIGLNNYFLAHSEGNIIEECEITNHLGGNITAMGFAGGSSGASISGIIRGNRIFLAPNPRYAEEAINNSWAYDTLIEGNYVNGAICGIYSDTGGYTNVMIAHNTFKNVYQGVGMVVNNSPEKNITVAFNNIELAPTTTYATAGFNFWGGILTNVFIFGNTISFTGPGPSTAMAIAADNITGLTFADNSIDSVIASNQAALTPYRFTNVVNLNMDNNYDLFGNYLYSLNIPTLGGVPVTPFGVDLASSAEASSALTNLGLPGNPAELVTNNETGVTLGGTFSGDGSGLTNLNTAPFSALAFGTMTGPPGQFYLINSAGCTLTNGSGRVGIQFTRPAANTSYVLLGNIPAPGTQNLTCYTNGFTFLPSATSYSFAVFSQ